MKYLIWIGILVQTVIYMAVTACAIAAEFVCTTETSTTAGLCVNTYKITFFQSIFSVITDLYVLLLPVKGTINLQLSSRRRLGVLFLFMIGLL